MKDSEPLRTAVDEVQPERVKLSLRLSQSKPLYEAFKGIKEGKLWGQLSEAQQRIVDGELRDFVLGGVALEVGCRRTRLVADTGASCSTCMPFQPLKSLTRTLLWVQFTKQASASEHTTLFTNMIFLTLSHYIMCHLNLSGDASLT